MVVRYPTKGPQHRLLFGKWCIYDSISTRLGKRSCPDNCACVTRSTMTKSKKKSVMNKSKEKVEILKNNLDCHISFIFNVVTYKQEKRLLHVSIFKAVSPLKSIPSQRKTISL